jgi:hypothetical protein
MKSSEGAAAQADSTTGSTTDTLSLDPSFETLVHVIDSFFGITHIQRGRIDKFKKRLEIPGPRLSPRTCRLPEMALEALRISVHWAFVTEGLVMLHLRLRSGAFETLVHVIDSFFGITHIQRGRIDKFKKKDMSTSGDGSGSIEDISALSIRHWGLGHASPNW